MTFLFVFPQSFCDSNRYKRKTINSSRRGDTTKNADASTKNACSVSDFRLILQLPPLQSAIVRNEKKKELNENSKNFLVSYRIHPFKSFLIDLGLRINPGIELTKRLKTPVL